MKMPSISLNKLVLLVTTILFTPAFAAAQTSQEPQPAPAQADQSDFEDGEEIVVLGRHIPEPMRETAEVVSVLTAEDLQRQGDDNAAVALTRLSGLSVVSNRFVYVRGLGDRYSSALLNGSPLPSPEPLRRQVPLDLFPSNILEGATVQKTFSPNYPGEFGGGVIDLHTLRIPTENFLNLKIGTGGNTESTDKRGFTYRGESSDWSGVADGLRDLPGPVANAIGSGKLINRTNFTPAQLETMGESFVSTPLTVVQSTHFDPDFSTEASGGASLNFGDFNLGLIGVVGYDSQMRTQRAQRVLAVVNSTPGEASDSVQSSWDIVLNGFASASLGWDTNEVTLTGLLVRSSTKRALQEIGTDNSLSSEEQALHQETGWYERQLAMLQVSGKHDLGPFSVDWRGAFAQSTRDAPYEREITYILSPAFPNGYYNENKGGNDTAFSYLTDEVGSAGVDVTYTLPLSDQRDAIFAGGVDWSNTVRWFDYYRFDFFETSSTLGMSDAARDLLLQSRPDYLFQPDALRADGFELQEITRPDDSYKGRTTVNAAYLSADVEVIPLVRVALGVRYEDATQFVRTINHFGAPTFADRLASSNPELAAPHDNTYWLPAATLTWNFAEDLQLRMGYSQTIARPQLRELAVSPFIDPDTGRSYRGNPLLKDSQFQNYDARMEYYFGQNQFVTAGAFYKKIEDPVEEAIFVSDRIYTGFLNAPQAQLYGAEFEYRTTFETPVDLLPFLDGESYRFGINYTYTHSEVVADATDTVTDPFNEPYAPLSASVFGLDKNPQMQGTPENLLNVQFGVDTQSSQMTLLVGWVDERILRRGNLNVPDVIEKPGINVDLTFRHDFSVGGKVVSLGASGRNLLDESHEEFQTAPQSVGGDPVTTNFNTYSRGRSFSVSLTTKF